MSKLKILEFPDPRLRTTASPVNEVDDALRALIGDMFETMYAAPGIGLAATQVDVHKRLLVADVSAERDDPYVLINPEILDEKVMSVIVEFAIDAADTSAVLQNLREIARGLPTIMAIGLSVRCDDAGNTGVEEVLAESGFDVVRAKTNLGLGRATIPAELIGEGGRS